MPGGSESFAVDIMAGSKLSVLSEGKVVRVELDEDNIVIDIHPSH
jgi:predicted RNA-binding protein